MRILAVLFPGVTALDMSGPATCWGLMPEAQIQLAALRDGPVKSDFGAEIIATHDLSNCLHEPDVELLPGGGRGVFEVLQDDSFLDHVARIGGEARWVTSVCTGSLILGAAGLLGGYKAACYWYCREQLRKFGAEPIDERVVIDRHRDRRRCDDWNRLRSSDDRHMGRSCRGGKRDYHQGLPGVADKAVQHQEGLVFTRANKQVSQ